jgi:hypothetical protein
MKVDDNRAKLMVATGDYTYISKQEFASATTFTDKGDFKNPAKAKIIDKGHVVNKIKRSFSVNGIDRNSTELVIIKKDRRSMINQFTDNIVFDAINEVGHDWVDVYNYLDNRFSNEMEPALKKAIDRHTI